MKLLTTKKKFYNKWIYKCSFCFPGTKFLRFELFVNTDANSDIGKLSELLDLYIKDSDYYLRVEGRICDVYCNDINIFNHLKTLAGKGLISCYSPSDENIERLKNNNRVILCKKLPYDRYNFKIYLQPHKVKDFDEKKQYIKWLESQSPKILISENTKKWFIRTQWNWDRRYMYADNEQTLLILKMKNGQAIGKIYSYEVCDK